jgi:hypothetical protein
MLSLGPLAIVIAAAAMLAALPATSAQACDNDRYPCPIVAQPETPDTAARAAPRKKASRAARQEEKARAKTERHASDAAARTKAAAPQQAQAAESSSQKSADPAPALTLDNQVDRNENPVAAAAAGSVVRPATGSAGAQATAGDEAAPAAPANVVRVVDPNELNELDLAAAAAPPAQSSWLGSLLMTLGAALAAASAVRTFFV